MVCDNSGGARVEQVAASLVKAQLIGFEYFDDERAELDPFGYTITCGDESVEITEHEVVE
jgi:hypothetical protein